ncbi:MAG: extracellular solute-binding protein [Desulfosalsimonadaceae bacterium]
MNHFQKIFIIASFLFLTAAGTAFAGESFPKAGWRDAPDPLADKSAQVGGEIAVFGGQYPKSLNYYLDNNTLSAEIFGALFESLLTTNPVTMDFEPGLADRWEIADDKKTFTFHINPNARWSDGTPVTAADVKWTFDAIVNPKNMTGSNKVSMERFSSPEILDPLTIRFTAKKIHWQNLLAAGGFQILSKTAYQKLDFNTINFELPVVSGPYQLGAIDEGVSLKLTRRSGWWHKDAPSILHKGNFETITYKFFAEQTNAFEAFKKGEIDLFPVYTSRIWMDETGGDAFLKNHIIKQKIHNRKPVGFQGFAMNMRKPPFDDIKTRKAMAFLLDRKKMNQTLMYNQYFLHRSYFEDLYSQAIPCPNPLIEMDKKQARDLLRQAGWTVNPATGFLQKNGQPFTFKFLTRDASSEKFLSIYAEDLKDVGINMVIDKKDWAAWARDMEEFNFQMTWAAWSSGLFKDPESMWLSTEADRPSGNNITGFKNQTVDQLIEKQKTIFNMEERNTICRTIDGLIYEACPYVLLWNIDYTRLLYWNKFGMPDTVLSKYGDESSAIWYWWLDPDAEAALQDAVKMKQPLPPKPASVKFDEVFQRGKQ